MINAANVELGIEYLDQCSAAGREATLVDMHWHIDAHNKCIPEAEEVNAVLAARPAFGIVRDGSAVRFAEQGSERSVSVADMAHARRTYHAQFNALAKKIR